MVGSAAVESVAADSVVVDLVAAVSEGARRAGHRLAAARVVEVVASAALGDVALAVPWVVAECQALLQVWEEDRRAGWVV
jgi:hypothetical protein